MKTEHLSKFLKTTLLSSFVLLFTLICTNCQAPGESLATEVTSTAPGWPEISRTTKPWTRWWWMGNAVDEKNLNHLLNQYADAGFGGVEITPIYGAMGFEDKYIEYLSPQWMNMLRFTVKKADSLGMGVDMNLGTGWPFGGPQIAPEQAASNLIVQTYSLKAGQQLAEKLTVKDPEQKKLGVGRLEALTAYNSQGESVNLLDKVGNDGTLDWSPEKGTWEIYAGFLGKTRQQVKRAAPGGAGYTMDHLSKDALKVYLSRFDTAFDHNVPDVRTFFNDSYEVYNADFTPSIFNEFEKLHGYDVRNYLKELVSKDTSEMVRRIRADYRSTMGELVLNNFTIPWTKWINEHNALSRNQAHGSPGNLLDLYGAVNIPECETFGSTQFQIKGLNKYTRDTRNVEPDPVMMKFASSAAHVLGKPLVSSETFTWLGEHFKVSLVQCKPEVEQVFLAGVNHVFYHGTTYSPEEAGWPGWMFYASVNFAPSNSFWPHLSGLNEYIARCQSVLQSGKADSEVLIYWPIDDLWYESEPEHLEKQISIHSIEEWLHPTDFYKDVETMTNSGYAVDFISDKMLDSLGVDNKLLQASEEGATYQVLVIPKLKFMPLATMKKIMEKAQSGASVIFQELPNDVPGFNDLESRRNELQQLTSSFGWIDVGNGVKEVKAGNGKFLLSNNVENALTYLGVEGEQLVKTGLKFIRRANGSNHSYFLVNHTAETIQQEIPLNLEATTVVILDPQTGEEGVATSRVDNGKTMVSVAIPSGESWILQTTNSKPADLNPWPYLQPAGNQISVTGNWQLEFKEGGPSLPTTQELTSLDSWTNLGDEQAENFSGTATYTISLNLDKKNADDYMLNLGDVRESAHVWVNGEDAGILWSVPFQVNIGKYLKAGENELKIEVANLMANRIRYLDKTGVEWRKYHEINFVNLEYKPFNAVDWELQPSGLLGPVTLQPMQAFVTPEQ